MTLQRCICWFQLHRPSVQERPLTLFEGVVHVELRHVVSVDVGEAHLGLVGHLSSLRGSDEALWD